MKLYVPIYVFRNSPGDKVYCATPVPTREQAQVDLETFGQRLHAKLARTKEGSFARSMYGDDMGMKGRVLGIEVPPDLLDGVSLDALDAETTAQLDQLRTLNRALFSDLEKFQGTVGDLLRENQRLRDQLGLETPTDVDIGPKVPPSERMSRIFDSVLHDEEGPR